VQCAGLFRDRPDSDIAIVAAELLHVSRPYVIGLLEGGAIPCRKVGKHRRVLRADVLKYKDKTAQARLRALGELADQAQDLDMGYGS
jgi:excisionase family DNA binding protein